MTLPDFYDVVCDPSRLCCGMLEQKERRGEPQTRLENVRELKSSIAESIWKTRKRAISGRISGRNGPVYGSGAAGQRQRRRA